MRIVVVQRGKLKDALVREARDEYVKRFARFGRLSVIEAPESGDGPLWSRGKGFRILLDERGKTMTSEQLAAQLQRWSATHGDLTFAVGGAYGHDEPTRAAAGFVLSLGPLTLPHPLAHLVLIEQLYRAATILAGMPYHHGAEDGKRGRPD